MPPQTEYAKSGEIGVAYQVVGEGEMDLVLAFPFVSHLDLVWESPALTHFVERLASFARVILFDRRGVGLSDPLSAPATLEERMDDVRAVMDAAGSERAALLGASEGGTMCMLFAATYPERTSALVLCGAMARSTWAEDYPWAPEKEAAEESLHQLLAPVWGKGASLEIFAPSLADNEQALEFQARYERQAASPMRVQRFFEMFLDLDVRDVLPLIQAPTLVMHRRHDRAVNVRAGRWLAEQIPGSRFVELEGGDHAPWAGPNSDEALDEIEEFLTGSRRTTAQDRMLATILVTDIVGSTARAASLGDHAWRELLDRHHAAVRHELTRFRGREIDTAGDGFLATFDGPARAIHCARAIRDSVRRLGLEIRAGLHTGEVELAPDGVRGIAVHTAARVCGEAEPDQVLVSSTVKDLVAGSGIGFEDRGTRPLKGVTEEWRLFSVVDG